MLRLLFPLLLITTQLHVYGKADEDPCNRTLGNRKPILRHVFLDEFDDEATVALAGGWIKMRCNSAVAHFLIKRSKNPLPGSQSDSETQTTNLTLRLDDSSKTEVQFICKCNNSNHKSNFVQWYATVCNRDQYNSSHGECRGNQICIVKKEQHKGNCQDPKIDDPCYMTNTIMLEVEYPTVCLGNTTDGQQDECKAGTKAVANQGWPMVETTGSGKGDHCKSEELRNFWEGNFSLRHNIAIKDTLTFRPRNNETTVCQNGTTTCHLKCFEDRQSKEVEITGSCSTGWTVTTNMTENCYKTKFYCIYKQNQADQKFRWQFYLYSANVEITFSGTKAQCEWPGWTGLGKTNPEAEKKTCHKEFNFPYPVNPEARKLQVGHNRSITDIPTMTTQTTTTATTTETTKQSTTTTTTITHIPDIANVTLNTTANVSQQMPPRNKAWSRKQNGFFILLIGQFLLFLLPSFMLYKEGSGYIKE